MKDLNLGAGDGDPKDLTVLGKKLYFTADSGSGRQLWVYEPNATPTEPKTNPRPIAAAGMMVQGSLHAHGHLLFFAASSTAEGAELWVFDSSQASGDSNPKLVKDIRTGIDSSNPAFFASAWGHVFFRAEDATGGQELWRSDGTAAGTRLAADIRPGTDSGAPKGF